MKIKIEEDVLEGAGAEIMEQLRLRTFDPAEFPDTESYIWHLRANYMRMTDRDCDLPQGDTETQARARRGRLAGSGALELVEGGGWRSVGVVHMAAISI